MIFRSKDALKKELQESECRTTNGIEALHRDLYRIVERKKSIIVTLRSMFCYPQSIENDFECFDNAFKVKDAVKKRYYIHIRINIPEIYNNVTSWYTYSYKPKKQRYVSDGRAPDTTLILLGSGKVY